MEPTDLVVVMDQARIVEYGSPGALTARDGAYARLLQAQRRLSPLHTGPG
ncbi:hypothetical protein ACIBH1_12010 [Nonomuraea sp. NPDC050663]